MDTNPQFSVPVEPAINFILRLQFSAEIICVQSVLLKAGIVANKRIGNYFVLPGDIHPIKIPVQLKGKMMRITPF